jgi:hypothetical protein
LYYLFQKIENHKLSSEKTWYFSFSKDFVLELRKIDSQQATQGFMLNYSIATEDLE